MVDIPVIGPGESMRLMTSHVGENVARIHHPLPVLELRKDLEKTYCLTEKLIMEAVADGYNSFYLDCLGMYGIGREREKTGFMVIDGGEASLKIAKISVDLGLTSNRIVYPMYPPPHR